MSRGYSLLAVLGLVIAVASLGCGGVDNASKRRNSYLFFAALGLRCYTQAFSSCGEWGLLSSCGE